MNCFGQGIRPEWLLEQCFVADVFLEPRYVGITAAEQHFEIGSNAPRQANGIYSRQAGHYQVSNHQIARIVALEDRQCRLSAIRLCNEVTDFAEILGSDPTDIRIVVYDKNVGSLGGPVLDSRERTGCLGLCCSGQIDLHGSSFVEAATDADCAPRLAYDAENHR